MVLVENCFLQSAFSCRTKISRHIRAIQLVQLDVQPVYNICIYATYRMVEILDFSLFLRKFVKMYDTSFYLKKWEYLFSCLSTQTFHRDAPVITLVRVNSRGENVHPAIKTISRFWHAGLNLCVLKNSCMCWQQAPFTVRVTAGALKT